MTEKERRRQELNDRRHLLADPAYRRELARELDQLKMAVPLFDADVARMAYNVAQREHGDWLTRECQEADARAFGLLVQEAARRIEDDARPRRDEDEPIE